MPEPFTIRRELRSGDFDIYRHLNQAVYHQLLEDGRVEYLREIGLGGSDRVVARVELDHRQEVPLGEPAVDLVIGVQKVGRSSMTLSNEIRMLDGTVAAEGIVVLVAWDPERRGSRPLTEGERTILEAAVATPA